jgi:peroxiredoxin (alkyl hydroperoxide reductase subunit C)
MKKVLISCALLLLFVYVNAQQVSIPEIGVEAPSFTAKSTEGKINFPSDYGNHWKILLSHPKDFTPVCSSEILAFSQEKDSFDDLNAKLVFVSSDDLDQHRSWVKALEEIRYEGKDPVDVGYPIVADGEHNVSSLYGMVHSKSSISNNIRGVYIIDPDNIIRAIQFYPNEVGRSVDETIRTLQALQTNYADNNLVTPANWQPGDDMIVPVISQEDREKIGTPGSNLYQVTWFMVYKRAE